MLRRRGGQYLVGTPRSKLRREFERQLLAEDWQQVRKDVEVKLIPTAGSEETYILCRPTARRENEQAIRSRFSARIEKTLTAIEKRVAAGQMPGSSADGGTASDPSVHSTVAPSVGAQKTHKLQAVCQRRFKTEPFWPG